MKQTIEEAARKELNSSYAIVIEGELAYQRQAMLNMFKKGAEWQLQQLSHPDPPGEQGADGTITIKEVMKEKAIEAFNEAMSYFESPDCPTAEEALKHFIVCLDQEPDSGCSEKPNNLICGDCDAFYECHMADAEHNDVACPGFDDSVLSQLNNNRL